MGKKKTGATKMSLSSFLGDAPASSWADEMDLPSAPAASLDLPRGPSGNREGSSSRGFERRDNDRYDRPQYSGPTELPTSAPYTAYVGNLAYDLNEQQIEDFFAGCAVKSVSIIKDRDSQKPKGFAYVEFETVESLSKALEFQGQDMNGRPLRVNIAEQRDRPESKTDGQWRREGPIESTEPKLSETASNWRRAEPLPPRESNRGGFNREGGGYAPRGEAREPREPRPVTEADTASSWRSSGGSRESGSSAFSSRRNDSGEGRGFRNESSTSERKPLKLLPRSKPE